MAVHPQRFPRARHGDSRGGPVECEPRRRCADASPARGTSSRMHRNYFADASPCVAPRALSRRLARDGVVGTAPPLFASGRSRARGADEGAGASSRRALCPAAAALAEDVPRPPLFFLPRVRISMWSLDGGEQLAVEARRVPHALRGCVGDAPRRGASAPLVVEPSRERGRGRRCGVGGGGGGAVVAAARPERGESVDVERTHPHRANMGAVGEMRQSHIQRTCFLVRGSSGRKMSRDARPRSTRKIANGGGRRDAHGRRPPR